MIIWVSSVSENSVPLNPMVFMIIIPMKNGYFIGNIPYFQTNPNMFMVSLLLSIISGRFVIQTHNFGYGFVGCQQILWWTINFRYNPNSQDSGIPGTC